MIDAPLEKIKGNWSRSGGQLTFDPARLEKARGEVTLDLSTLKTTTFGDAGQDARQTAHALNWMEIGDEVPSETRTRYRTATFRIDQVVSAEPSALGAETGSRSRVKVRGSMTLHGVRSEHEVELEITAEGDPNAPTALRVVSKKPLRLSLKQHDIKPRDLAGRFLAGALEQVGQKISDTVQVSLDLRLERK